MSLRLEQVLNNTRPWLGAGLVFGVLALFSAIMPSVTGQHARLRDQLRPSIQEVSASTAVEDSLAGRAVIVDLRPLAERQAKPIPGGAILPPGTLDRPQWNLAGPLLESLAGTPVHVILPPDGAGRQAFRKLRGYKLDLRLVEEGF